MTDILLIPGAFSSATSFNYMISVFSQHPNVEKIHTFEYCSVTEHLTDIINRANKTLTNLDQPVIVVGHSLGGVIAATLVNHRKSQSTLTISAPLSGIKLNRLVAFYLSHSIPIFDDLTESSPIIQSIHNAKYTKSFTMLASTHG